MINGDTFDNISEMILGEGEDGAGAGASITIPNPLGIEHKKYNFDVYKALVALHVFSMVDIEQFPNNSDTTTKVLNRVEYFTNEVRKKWPGAFE